MSIDKVTKEEWDRVYKESISNTEETLVDSMSVYIKLLNLRSSYRKAYKTHTIIHEIDYAKGMISYRKGPKRKIGFDYKKKQK